MWRHEQEILFPLPENLDIKRPVPLPIEASQYTKSAYYLDDGYSKGKL